MLIVRFIGAFTTLFTDLIMDRVYLLGTIVETDANVLNTAVKI